MEGLENTSQRRRLKQLYPLCLLGCHVDDHILEYFDSYSASLM
jgi:hypothetical protein